MVYINGQQLDSIGALSTRSQSVLSMITGGQKWLSWCIADSSITTINPASEDQLLKLIQQGLSADGYIRFNTFRASMNKILSMSDVDIAQLAAIKHTINDNETNLAVMLQQNNMFSYGDMAETSGLITQLASGRPDLFQAVSFDDMLILTDFVKKQQGVDPDLQAQSNAFALANATTLPDFVNLSLFFQYTLQNQLNKDLISQTQSSQIEDIYIQLQATLAPYLFTPVTDAAITNGTLLQIIPELARATTFIGYATASSAILNLVQNITVRDLPDTGLQARISNYLNTVKTFISNTASPGYTLSQNGKSATLTFQAGQSLACVGVDWDGTVFLLPDTKINSN